MTGAVVSGAIIGVGADDPPPPPQPVTNERQSVIATRERVGIILITHFSMAKRSRHPVVNTMLMGSDGPKKRCMYALPCNVQWREAFPWLVTFLSLASESLAIARTQYEMLFSRSRQWLCGRYRKEHKTTQKPRFLIADIDGSHGKEPHPLMSPGSISTRWRYDSSP
jgi:hypothetical protein